MRSTPTFEAHRAERDEDGHALVVGNGTARPLAGDDRSRRHRGQGHRERHFQRGMRAKSLVGALGGGCGLRGSDHCRRTPDARFRTTYVPGIRFGCILAWAIIAELGERVVRTEPDGRVMHDR